MHIRDILLVVAPSVLSPIMAWRAYRSDYQRGRGGGAEGRIVRNRDSSSAKNKNEY
jgi:hypothetical protein